MVLTILRFKIVNICRLDKNVLSCNRLKEERFVFKVEGETSSATPIIFLNFSRKALGCYPWEVGRGKLSSSNVLKQTFDITPWNLLWSSLQTRRNFDEWLHFVLCHLWFLAQDWWEMMASCLDKLWRVCIFKGPNKTLALQSTLILLNLHFTFIVNP